MGDTDTPRHADAAPFAVGQQVGHYRIVSRLTSGGMGVLYVAEDNLHRRVVLKVLATALAGDPVQRARLRREAEAMARLQHPFIATVHAFEELDGVTFLVTEYVKGGDLRDRLQGDGPMSPREVVDLGIATAEALGAAHAAGSRASSPSIPRRERRSRTRARSSARWPT
jgi:serine/threonine protein kinase